MSIAEVLLGAAKTNGVNARRIAELGVYHRVT
jgi:hypothetical protein